MILQTTPLRPPAQVMTLNRLGAFHQTRISFVRSLIRTIMQEGWTIDKRLWEINDDGFGTAVYDIVATADEPYSLVFFSNYLADEDRTDRVIAEKWDVAFALCEGNVTESQIELLRRELPKQEAGRYLPFVLVISRANKSTRNFDHVINSLSSGSQPSVKHLKKVGYLYRTTAVYGNGKFGIADYEKLARTASFKATFRAQMFTVYMLRHFTLALVNDLAHRRSPGKAVQLDPQIARYLGIGNATGLGMAPFLATHPQLIHRWILARETALGRVLKFTKPDHSTVERFRALLGRASQHIDEIDTVHSLQQQKNRTMRAECDQLADLLDRTSLDHWQTILDWGTTRCEEMQELSVSILLELYPELVDPLADEMNTSDSMRLEPLMSLVELVRIIERGYRWALELDFSDPSEQHFFWYRSADKEEPRLGVRLEEHGADQEQWLGIGRDVAALYHRIRDFQSDPTHAAGTVLDYVQRHPIDRGLIRRIQSLAKAPYGEIHDNLLGRDCLPIDLLRCKLSFFGASKFDPRSNLWVRITLFQGAPLVEEIGEPFQDDWFWPVAPALIQANS